MFSSLAALGQVIPRGSESPFLAARLRRCRAWNPITSAAMPALWHQTPSMQNATAGVYQQRAPQSSRCRGVHWWVTRLTRSRGDDTGDTRVGQNGERRIKPGWGKQVEDESDYIWKRRRGAQWRGNKYFNFVQTLFSGDLFFFSLSPDGFFMMFSLLLKLLPSGWLNHIPNSCLFLSHRCCYYPFKRY